MISVSFDDDNNVTLKEFIDKVNKARKVYKGKWVQAVAIVDGKYVEYKAFNTWIQILRVDDIDHSGIADVLVLDYLHSMRIPFEVKETVT